MVERGRNLVNGLEWIAGRCLITNEPFVEFVVVGTAFLYAFYSPVRTRKVIRFWRTTRSGSTTI